MGKVESIEELRNVKPVQTEEQEVSETALEYYKRIANRENREKNVIAIGEFALKSDLKLEELILGMADYCSGMLVASVADNMPNDEQLSAAEQKFNEIRIALAGTLNDIKDTSMGDNVLAMLALISESITILADETVRTIAGE